VSTGKITTVDAIDYPRTSPRPEINSSDPPADQEALAAGSANMTSCRRHLHSDRLRPVPQSASTAQVVAPRDGNDDETPEGPRRTLHGKVFPSTSAIPATGRLPSMRLWPGSMRWTQPSARTAGQCRSRGPWRAFTAGVLGAGAGGLRAVRAGFPCEHGLFPVQAAPAVGSTRPELKGWAIERARDPAGRSRFA